MKQHGSILDEIVEHKRREVEQRKSAYSIDNLEAKAESGFPPRDFLTALNRRPGQALRALAEIKLSSPSRGTIRNDTVPSAIAQAYESAGASALSVLTDEKYFSGNDNHLVKARAVTRLPTLRKDFTIDEYQIWEARVIGADAILLMAQILEPDEIHRFLELAHRLDMVALVEGHDEEEIDAILETDAQIIGINNRDFRTMETDIQTTLRLRERIPDNRIIVSQSGISEPDQARELSNAGVHAIQVGTSLMEHEDPGAKLASLLNAGM